MDENVSIIIIPGLPPGFVDDKIKCISDFPYFLLEFSLCYKRLDHGGDTVDLSSSKCGTNSYEMSFLTISP